MVEDMAVVVGVASKCEERKKGVVSQQSRGNISRDPRDLVSEKGGEGERKKGVLFVFVFVDE